MTNEQYYLNELNRAMFHIEMIERRLEHITSAATSISIKPFVKREKPDVESKLTNQGD